MEYSFLQNSINKCQKITPGSEEGGKKKIFTKNMAWRKSFAQFLKRRRYHSHAATAPQQQQPISHHPLLHQNQHQNQHQQQQQPSPGNNNNNDLAHVDPTPVSRNGISALGQQPNKLTDLSTGTEDHTVVTSQDVDNFKLATTLSSVPVENNVIGMFC